MKLQKLLVTGEGNGYAYYFYCPGCKQLHQFRCESKKGPNWKFSESFEHPTFTPSLLMFTTNPETGERRTLCHLFLTAGIIEFCGDCPHELAGKIVPLEDIPEDMVL